MQWVERYKRDSDIQKDEIGKVFYRPFGRSDKKEAACFAASFIEKEREIHTDNKSAFI